MSYDGEDRDLKADEGAQGRAANDGGGDRPDLDGTIKALDRDIEQNLYEFLFEDLMRIIEDRMSILLREEFGSIRDRFVERAKKAEEEKLKALLDEYRKIFMRQLERKEAELQSAQKVINIQAALLSRLAQQDRDNVVRVLRNANLSEDELQLLSGDQQMRLERGQ